MTTSAEEVYLNALERLKERGEAISLNKVAVEAGKKPGSLRANRYPSVCEAVQMAIDSHGINRTTKENKRTFKDRIEDLEVSNREYKAKYHVALNRLLILESQLYQEGLKTKR